MLKKWNCRGEAKPQNVKEGFGGRNTILDGEVKMPTYYWIMGIYTVMVGYLLFILIWNLFDCEDFWEQIVAIFVVIPFLLRLLYIK